MTSVFAEVVNMSSMAIWLILAVVVVRFLCRKATKNLCYFLWALVGIRLLCPFTIESPWSLIPTETSYEKFVDAKNSMKEELGIGYTGSTSNVEETIKTEYESLQETLEQNLEALEGETQGLRPIEIVTIIWFAGVVLILGYTAISFFLLKRKVAVSVRKGEGIWICDAIASPFVLGIFKPRVYLPSNVEEEQIGYIMAHEKSHLKWHDNIWKPVGLIILAIHWFNPLVWLAYSLLCRDIELACDERVVKTMDEEEKRNYIKSLLICSSPRQFAGIASVAFGEISIRKRVKGVLNYKKASFWRVLVSSAVCLTVVVGFMTNPKGQEFIAEVEQEIKDELKEMRKEKVVIYETAADLDHDGIDDLVQVVRTSCNEEGYERIDYPTNKFFIKILWGQEDGGYRNREVNLEPHIKLLWDVWIGKTFNGLYAITEKDGKDYLLRAQVCEFEGNAHYMYEVVDVEASSNVGNRVAYKTLTFACDPFYSQWDTEPHREDIVPEFREGITPWLENAKIILCSDENGVYVAEKGKEQPANEYFDSVWQRNDEDKITEYESLSGEARWEKIMYRDSMEADTYISWINQLASSDLSKWFEDYNGEFAQRINHHKDGSQHCSLSTCCDVIYQKDVFLRESLYRMFRKMVEGKQEKEAVCTYDISAFGYSEQPVVQISEHVWLVCYFNGYYGYQGVDGVTYEERVASITNYYDFDNGLVPLPRDGETSEYWFVLIEKDDVYRLERLKNMMER